MIKHVCKELDTLSTWTPSL